MHNFAKLPHTNRPYDSSLMKRSLLTFKILWLVEMKWSKQYRILGRNPGLVVLGDYSCLKGCGFESQHSVLDGHDIFSRWFVLKLYCLLEKAEKEAGVGPFKNNLGYSLKPQCYIWNCKETDTIVYDNFKITSPELIPCSLCSSQCC